jgi:class 3 adenylate cyclase
MRIGAHTGEVIREGDDFFGRTVIIAARVTSEASGGEILVTDALRAAASTVPVGVGASREVSLKGLAGVHRVHRIEWGRGDPQG